MEHCCALCGKNLSENSFYSHYMKSHKAYVHLCHDCWLAVFWHEVLTDPNVIIYRGEAYTVVPSSSAGGFDKRAFDIYKCDGTELKNVGLWYNGVIPKEYGKVDTVLEINIV